MKTLRALQIEIENLQAQYRRISSLNTGVIRGAVSVEDLSKQIHEKMRIYNRQSKRTEYRGGVIHARKA